MNLVITFSRGYGTGTSIITDELSKRLHVPVYGRDYICRKVQDEANMEEQNIYLSFSTKSIQPLINIRNVKAILLQFY